METCQGNMLGTRGVLILLTDRKVITDSECCGIRWLPAQRMRRCEHARGATVSEFMHLSKPWLTATVCGLCQMGLYRSWALMGFSVCIRVNDVSLIILFGSNFIQNAIHKVTWIHCMMNISLSELKINWICDFVRIKVKTNVWWVNSLEISFFLSLKADKREWKKVV